MVLQCSYTPTHTSFLSNRQSALQLAEKPDIINALRAAGAHDEEREENENDLKQGNESEEGD